MNELEILKNIPKKIHASKQRKKMVTCLVTEVEHRYLKGFCQKHNITVSSLMRELTINFLTNIEKKENG
tara:strand:+ start:1119 stop:1325 length:207 start_codon:yes stop_codon:yes gene_type:complete